MGKSLHRGFCRKDRVRVGTGECERCQDSGAQGPSLVVWYLARGRLGLAEVAGSVSLIKEMVGLSSGVVGLHLKSMPTTPGGGGGAELLR